MTHVSEATKAGVDEVIDGAAGVVASSDACVCMDVSIWFMGQLSHHEN